MRQEIYDYNIRYFDGDYKTKELRFVIDSTFDKKHCEITFFFIKEIDENNNVIIGSEILPYAEVLSVRVLLFDLVDNKLLKRDESIQEFKHSIYRKRSYARTRKYRMGGVCQN